MVKNKRSTFIDVLKGLLITLVVIGHLPFFEYNSRTITLIYSFHMPAFLIIGGMLSHIDEKSTFSGILYKRFKGTLVPYFVFYLVVSVLIPIDSYESKVMSLISIFSGVGNPDYAIDLPLWFLTFYFVALTVFEMIQCFFYKIKLILFDKAKGEKNTHTLFVMIFTLIIIAFFMRLSFIYARILKGSRLPYNFEIALFCLGFVYFGKVLGIFVPSAYAYVKKNTAFAVIISIIMIIVLSIFTFIWYQLSMKNGRIDLNARDYKDAALMYLDAIIGFLVFSAFSFIVSFIPIVKNLFALFGQNSLYILAYHVPSTFITYNIILPMLPSAVSVMVTTCSIPSILLLTTLGIVISLFFGLIHKICHIPA